MPVASSGYLEAMVLVKGGYTPDVILVEHGKPVRLNFRREESAACSEMAILGDFGKSAKLPEGETVPVEFGPERAGEYEFARQRACCAASWSLSEERDRGCLGC